MLLQHLELSRKMKKPSIQTRHPQTKHSLPRQHTRNFLSFNDQKPRRLEQNYSSTRKVMTTKVSHTNQLPKPPLRMKIRSQFLGKMSGRTSTPISARRMPSAGSFRVLSPKQSRAVSFPPHGLYKQTAR